MRYIINNIVVYSNKPETLTQAYHAGIIVSQVENFLPKEKIPSVGTCLANFHSLRELFGERLWQKLKSKSRFRDRILIYEKMAYQPFLPKSIIGTGRDFCVGYMQSYEKSNVRKYTNYLRLKDANVIIAYLDGKSSSL